MRRRTAFALALPILTIAFGLAACSGGAPSPGGTSPASGSGSSGGGYEEEFDAYNLKMTGCLRDQGIDVKDPEPGIGLTFEDTAAFTAAFETCTGTVGPQPTHPDLGKNTKERLDQGLKIAKCLREKGYDVKDPGPDGAVEVPSDLDSGSLVGTGCENL